MARTSAAFSRYFRMGISGTASRTRIRRRAERARSSSSIRNPGLDDQIARGRMADPDQRIKRVRGVAREPKIPKGTANSLGGRSEGFLKEAVCPRLDFRHLVGHERESI